MPVKELNINKNTCGKWKSRYILDILEKYPQTNFQEWELLEMHHQNNPNEIAVNMVCKFGILMLILGEELCAIGQSVTISLLQNTEIK